MRKDIQKGVREAKKRKIYYLSAIGVIVTFLMVAVVVMIYIETVGNSINENFPEINGLAKATNEADLSEKTSSVIGKNIEEVQNDENEKNDTNTNDNVLVVKTAENETTNKPISNEPEEIKEIKQEKSNNDDKEKVVSNTETKEEVKVQEPVFTMPVDGEIIREFANDKLVYSDTLKEWITHTGIDIKAEKTSIVKASEAGTIKSIKNDPRYGVTVVIEHNMRI